MLTSPFTSHGYTYTIDINGAIRQVNPDPFVYDEKYCATYDTEAYRRGNEILQALRLSFATAVHDRNLKNIADVGYGNGAFMRFATQQIRDVQGFDITGIEVEGCKTTVLASHFELCPLQVDVMTFFDCLEHIADISFLSHLQCETLIISLPWCHARQQGLPWFETQYKHRKPNEHLWHFDFTALLNTLKQHGWNLKAVCNIEDIVRKSAHGLQNILTAGFKR